MIDNQTGTFPDDAPEVNPFAERAATETRKAEATTKALIPWTSHGIEFPNVEAAFRYARMYLQSRLAPPAIKNEQQLVVIWATAAELGLSPMQAVAGFTIINNRVGIMGDLALAMVEASGLLQKKSITYTGEGDELTCHLMLKRKGRDPQVYTFSIAEAKQAQIYERSPVWKGYPKRMCYYRALGFGLRDEFADVMKGVKTTEELQDYPENGK